MHDNDEKGSLGIKDGLRAAEEELEALESEVRSDLDKLEDLEDLIAELIDVEECGKRGERPPKAKEYIIRIDRKRYNVKQSSMTGRELLELAGKRPPEKYEIFEKLHDGNLSKIELDQSADFRKCGVERFQTLPLNEKDGRHAQAI